MKLVHECLNVIREIRHKCFLLTPDTMFNSMNIMPEIRVACSKIIRETVRNVFKDNISRR